MTGEAVTFGAGDVTLEGRLHRPGGRPRARAVVCHPHPRYGGDMNSEVVAALCRRLALGGAVALRFNFRGAGASGGRHDGGRAERADVVAAVDRVLAEAADGPLWLLGYSFGAWVSGEAPVPGGVDAWVAVAPPLAVYPMDGWARRPEPKLAVVGDRDAFCPLERFDGWWRRVVPPAGRSVVAGADHFFLGREAEVADRAAGFLEGAPPGGG